MFYFFLLSKSSPLTAGGTDSLKIKESSNSFLKEETICKGSAPALGPTTCDDLSVDQPQAGADVTWGYKGLMEVDHDPIPNPFGFEGLCPVNVHWHLGAEHRSAGQYDENGTGPDSDEYVKRGFRCHHYDADDPKFTTPYEFKHCSKKMEVGETYEVHWPHATTGACGTIYQYQTPFLDGVFCNLSHEEFNKLTPQDLAKNVGVQGQVFTIVNDEDYFYPDLMRGMIVDIDYSKPMGVDLTIYTGSATGDKFDNKVCTPVTPVTWQVDRKCHLISASSFDAMCAEMKLQVSDMTPQIIPEGSRDLVADEYAADNQLYIGKDTQSSGLATVAVVSKNLRA